MKTTDGLADPIVENGAKAPACPFAGNARAPMLEAIVESSLEPYISLDALGRVIAWNEAAAQTFGWTQLEALGKSAADLFIPAELRERHRKGMTRYRPGVPSNIVAKRVRIPAVHRDGSSLAVELRVGVAVETDGTRTYHAFVRNVTENERVRSELEMQNALLSESQRVASLGSYQHDVRSGLSIVSDELLAIVGVSRDAFGDRPEPLLERIHPDDRESAMAAFREALRRGTTYEVEHRIVRGEDSAERVLRHVGYVTRGADGRAIRAFATVQDVTDRRRAEAQQLADRAELEALHERSRRSFEDAPVGMALADVDLHTHALGRFRDVNAALCQLTGQSRETLSHGNLSDLVDPTDVDTVNAAIDELLDGRTNLVAIEVSRGHVERPRRWFLVHVSLVREPDRAAFEPYAIVQLIDITAAKRAEKRLEYLADHDPLTELLNRRGLATQIRTIAAGSIGRAMGALLLLDLDYFKYVNDTRGHAIGDRLLQSVALTLRRLVGPNDFVARLGGDEFIVVLLGVDEPAALATADAIREAISSEIQRYSRSRLHVTVSVGIAMAPDGFGGGIDEILSRADGALAQAKEGGRNRAFLSASNAGGRETMLERLDWAQRIRTALRTGGFRLYRQPILELRTGVIERYELLIRMVEDETVIAPAVFIREAERFGLTIDIDTWVVGEALRICDADERAGRAITYEINLSGASLSHGNTATMIVDAIGRAGIDPKRLIFEVTETAAIQNMERASELANALGRLGCAFALDDFGAGFSSYYYLKRLPFAYLKIDGEFIRNLPNDESDQHIVRSIVALARGLGKKTIAEFVTDERTAEFLRTYGVDYAQGYHIGKPTPFDVESSVGA